MSRPSARRRPTALRATEADQQYVLTATLITFSAFACSAYAYTYSRHGSTSQTSLISAALCAGLSLCGSAIQRQLYPLGQAASNRLIHISDTASVLCCAIGLLSKFLLVEQLGVERGIATLLPIECLIRAHRGGFSNKQAFFRYMFVAILGICIIVDLYSTSTILQIVLGYVWLALAYFTTSMSLSLEHETGDVSIWSGVLLLLLGATFSWFGNQTKWPFSSLDIVVLIGLIVSRAWSATQPKAIWTALSLGWPVVVGLSIFVGFNIVHSVSWAQLVSYGMLYYALTTSIQTSGLKNPAQSTANTKSERLPGTLSITYYLSEITKDKESRDIFYFLLLNLSFMVVQMLYGIWTNSLGLISDSIHMFFDCLALAVGLVAAVMSKWPASQTHPFGFAKVEIISGFANGIFLVLISISIMIEAFERLMEPPEMHTDQLLLISTLGLCVNLVGIFAFNHGHHHGHSHGGHDHHHGHDHKAKPEPLPTIHTPKVPKSDGTFDHARGLNSPMPDFSNFSGFDSPKLSSSSFDYPESVDTGRSRSALSMLTPESNGFGNRSRSPIRRPGSPLKSTHEPILADLAEVNERTPEHTKTAQLHHDTDRGNQHDIHRHQHDIHRHHHHHDHDLDHGHHNGHIHDHGHKSETEPRHGKHIHSASTSHARNLSYDLTADHSHVNNSCTSHGDHSHTHSRKHNAENMIVNTDQADGHDHSHNMEGIFLHILADTLGSGGVIVSTLLIRLFGWTGFDPLASIFIAVLIFLSVIPLLRSSFADLLLTLQDDQEYTLREVLGEVSLISGVGDIPFIRFWVDGNQKMHGILTIRAGIDGDTDLVRQKVRRKLQDGVPNLADIIVQVDRLE